MHAPPHSANSSEIHTQRLLLRCPCAGDGVAVYAAIVESQAELRAWGASLPWAMAEPSVATSEAFCRTSRAEFIRRTALVYLVFELATQRLVGSVGLHPVGGSTPGFELGFWCRTSLCGRGYTREASAALLAYARKDLGAQRVDCITDARNTRSRHLCECLGMRLKSLLHYPDPDVPARLQSHCVYTVSSA